VSGNLDFGVGVEGGVGDKAPSNHREARKGTPGACWTNIKVSTRTIACSNCAWVALLSNVNVPYVCNAPGGSTKSVLLKQETRGEGPPSEPLSLKKKRQPGSVSCNGGVGHGIPFPIKSMEKKTPRGGS